MDWNIEGLAQIVRDTWIAYCKETGDTKPSHIASWENMSEWEKEADRRIAAAILDAVLRALSV